jgi:hypothetical protein
LPAAHWWSHPHLDVAKQMLGSIACHLRSTGQHHDFTSRVTSHPHATPTKEQRHCTVPCPARTSAFPSSGSPAHPHPRRGIRRRPTLRQAPPAATTTASAACSATRTAPARAARGRGRGGHGRGLARRAPPPSRQ